MAVWVEDLTKDSFKVCLREVKIFDGLHKGIKIVSKILYLTGVSAQNLRDTYSPFWTMYYDGVCNARRLLIIILLHEKFLQFDWLREVVFQYNLKYFHVKITKLLRVVV